ncbi:actin interacting protein 3 [Colletotrichum somersetense]|nr:actin interacting protein 3 [Colletotrichum somersetense]
MQAPGSSQRMQRRSPGAEPGPPPSVPARSISPAMGMQPRSSNASNRSAPPNGGMRRSNNSTSSAMPLSQIEKSVTHLLVATKQLLETLTQWSRGQATDGQVSDVYVRLGYEFNMACRAFTAINVDTSDLGNVPELLRSILEATLSQEASTESLEKYLPRIRDIIINLLHGLKRKQQKLRQKQPKDRESGGSSGAPERMTSTSTIGSANTGLTNLLEEGIQNGYRPDPQRESSMSAGAPTTTSPSRRYIPGRDQSRGSVNSEQSSLSSNTMQNMPVVPPYPGEEASMPSAPLAEAIAESFPPPPPPPKQQSSAFAALQKGGDLERRASRRYSQYQISKHLGSAMNGLDASPARAPSRTKEAPPAEVSITRPESPTIQTPEDKYPKASATLKGPLSDELPIMSPDDDRKPEPPSKDDSKESPRAKTPEKKRDPAFLHEQSPPLTTDLTLFLQYKSKVKKFVLPEGYSELSIGRLQLAFIEKFSWNTHANGADLPEIYIQDPVSGVRHELEDLSDIKDRTVLVLNVEPLDEVKRHIDEGIGQLKKIVQDVKQNMDDQGLAIQRVSERQQEAATEIAKLASAPPVVSAPADGSRSVGGRKLAAGHITEIQSLRRDLAVMRQAYSNFQSEIQGSMSAIRAKASNVKAAVVKASVPSIEGETGHAYVARGREQLNADSDRLVTKVDDLQDLVEDLRKDVVHRGVRPLPRQLETVAMDITKLSKELKKVEDYMKEEKPIWTKIWEKELEDVCKGRDELRLMEDLMIDLQDDLEKASETFALVEQATKEQLKDNGTTASAGTARNFSKGLNNLGNSPDPNAAKDGVLGEVRALQPNHENRLEAIERAEKLRQKELEGRKGNELQRELSSFVEEGKLKKSGGFEEVERTRKAKDDMIRRQVWERQNGIIAEDGEGEEEEEEEEVEYEEVEEEEEEEPGEAGGAEAAPDADKATAPTAPPEA